MEELSIEPIRPSGMDTSGTAAIHYLVSLAESGRRTMTSALRAVGEILLGHPVDEAFDVPWGQLRYEHVSAVRAVLLARYAPATVNKHLTAIRGVARAAWRMKFLDADDLARIVDVPNVKGSRLKAGRMLDREELQALWAQTDTNPRGGALMALLFSAGLRRTEAAKIRLVDIDTRTEADGSETVWLRVMGKGAKQRKVPVRGTAACRILRQFRHVQAEWTRRGMHEITPRLLGVQSGRSVAKLLSVLVKQAGVAPCSPHDFRRSFVSHALAAGAPIADVARAAGHSDPRTTAGYDRRDDDALLGVADAVSTE